MDELKALRKQQAEIEKKIAAILDRDYAVCGRAKIGKESADGHSVYRVSVKAEGNENPRANCWLGVIVGADRDAVIAQIQDVVKDLNDLYAHLSGPEEDK